MPSTPALMAKISVLILCNPLGLAHPSSKGVEGIESLEARITRVMSHGEGGAAYSIGV